KRGAVLGVVARRKELLDDLVARCEAAGGKARAFVVDVVDADGLRGAADEFRSQFGHIDIMIANAGISGKSQETRDFVPSAVKEVIDTNLMGAINSVGAVLPEMLERGSGHLVAISSLAGFRGLPRSAAYSASKAAMTAYFESVRLDVQDRGVAVTIIQPGFIRTPLTANRAAKMPFLMYLDDAIPYFRRAMEQKKRFAAFPWQLATIVRIARFLPAKWYDAAAGRAKFRE
ncbi:MAG TPA: SDR family NAD(P)-dependent oxidoreductase, partial [Pyrinomonadaceae bacterium]|nr:SDR family NAD(P)-dependent oxidoreductase [Pyrinomonadaceae bacterium]